MGTLLVANRVFTRMVALSLLLCGGNLLVAGDAQAQTWPLKTVKVLVGLAPGGPPDIAARLITPKLGEALGQPVIVENHSSAGGIIMMEQVAKAAPDGYTLGLVSVGTMFLAKAMFPAAPFDPINSFTPVGRFAKTAFVLVSSPELPARTLKEFVEFAKAQPGKLNYGASVVGTVPHVLAEMFKSQVGVNIVGINYKGAAESISRFQAGDVHMVVETFALLEPVVARNKAIALLVTTTERSRRFPGVPSAAEAGMPDFCVESWYGLVAPKGTPASVVRRLNGELIKAVALKDVAEAIEKVGLEAVSNTPEEFEQMIKTDWPKWAGAVKASGAKAH